MKNEELTAQVSALDIKPGTIVLVKFEGEITTVKADQIGKALRAVVPEENRIIIAACDVDIQALDEAKMRELGWVRSSTVEPLVSCAELLADNLRRDAESAHDDDESVGLVHHANNVDALVRRVKGIEPELPLG